MSCCIVPFLSLSLYCVCGHPCSPGLTFPSIVLSSSSEASWQSMLSPKEPRPSVNTTATLDTTTAKSSYWQQLHSMYANSLERQYGTISCDRTRLAGVPEVWWVTWWNETRKHFLNCFLLKDSYARINFMLLGIYWWIHERHDTMLQSLCYTNIQFKTD